MTGVVIGCFCGATWRSVPFFSTRCHFSRDSWVGGVVSPCPAATKLTVALQSGESNGAVASAEALGRCVRVERTRVVSGQVNCSELTPESSRPGPSGQQIGLRSGQICAMPSPVVTAKRVGKTGELRTITTRSANASYAAVTSRPSGDGAEDGLLRSYVKRVERASYTGREPMWMDSHTLLLRRGHRSSRSFA